MSLTTVQNGMIAGVLPTSLGGTGTTTLTFPSGTGTVFAGNTSTVQQGTNSSSVTGSNSANTWTDISGASLTLVSGTYLFSYYATIESQSVSGSTTPVQGCSSILAIRTSGNTLIDAVVGNYANLNITYNIEALSKSIVYTVSATTTYKLSFTYTQNSGSPTINGFYARGDYNGNPSTFTAIKLY